MTLDEAIQHLRESLKDPNHFSCAACKDEHRQLLEWLKELKMRRYKAERLKETRRS